MGWFQQNRPDWWVDDLRRDHKLILLAIKNVQKTCDLILAAETLDTLQRGRFDYVIGPITNKPDRAVGLGLSAGQPTMKER